MGYTHYWRLNRDGNQDNYQKALDDCKKIVKACTKEFNLCDGYGAQGTTPDTTDDLCFNGCEEDSHETFLLPSSLPQQQPSYKDQDDPWIFDFCKTARKPYDNVVVACLVALKDNLGDDVRVSSDGWGEKEKYREYDMMEHGLEIAKQVLGRELSYPFSDDEE